MKITKCPVCQGPLEATEEIDCYNVTIDENCNVIRCGDKNHGDYTLYCENDCTLDEIYAALEGAREEVKKKKERSIKRSTGELMKY